jgi:hypothetical protein
MYNGDVWGGFNTSGHAVAINTDSQNPTVSLKLHKSWSEGGDYLPRITLWSMPSLLGLLMQWA